MIVIRAMVEVGTGALFLQAAWSKALHPDEAAGALRSVGLTGSRKCLICLIVFEAGLGSLLSTGWASGLVLPLTIGVLLLFTVFLVRLRMIDASLPCGCGVLSELSVPPEPRNAVLLAALGAAMFAPPPPGGIGLTSVIRLMAAVGVAMVLTAFAERIRARHNRSLATRWGA